MKYSEMLKVLIDERGGLIFTKEITKAGIPRVYVSQLVEHGILERLERGAYITKDALDDEMYRLQAKYPSVIFSHDTALFLHDLSDRDPLQYTVTVPAGYNAQNIKNSGVKVFSIRKEFYGLGVTTANTSFGREVKTYDVERTICDLLRSRNQMDIAVVTDAVKRYSKRRAKNLPLLMRYAKIFKVTNILRSYLEVLL